MPSLPRSSIPKQGQLVEVRQRRYVVNVDSLYARAAQILAEIALETAVIRACYADPSPRLFLVAVTFLVPEQLVR